MTTYKQAGVDIQAGNQLVDRIKPHVKSTHQPGVLTSLGGFGGAIALPTKNYDHPVLVAGTDGVGTKLRLAIDLNRHSTIGIDLVAMCVNDILAQGAKPFCFLDYYATDQLDVDIATHVIAGITDGCKMAHIPLIGGETAEMPGHYHPGDYDLAGFAVGLCDQSMLLCPTNVKPGHTLVALPSTGPHANGYSLIRHIIASSQIDLTIELDSTPLEDILLTPTAIYVDALWPLIEAGHIAGCAHITGGGLTENIPRMLAKDCTAQIDLSSWQPAFFWHWLQEIGGITSDEMLRTFNCGVGMVLSVDEHHIDIVMQRLEDAWVIGTVTKRVDDDQAIVFNP